MKTAIATTQRPRLLARPERTRHRTDLPIFRPLGSPTLPSRAENDFLIPNPRPDLTHDLTTLRMIEAG